MYAKYDLHFLDALEISGGDSCLVFMVANNAIARSRYAERNSLSEAQEPILHMILGGLIQNTLAGLHSLNVH